MDIENNLTKGKEDSTMETKAIQLFDDDTMETEKIEFLPPEDDSFYQIKEVLSFRERENAGLIKLYGSNNYNVNRELELSTVFPLGYLKPNKISSKFR
jgi:hypothetical protein